MRINNKLRAVTSVKKMVLLAAALSAAGCANQFSKQVAANVEASDRQAQKIQQILRQAPAPRKYVFEDDTPRFTSGSTALDDGAKLPQRVGWVTARYPGRRSLESIADLISRLVDIPVIMAPDALMSAAEFTQVHSASNSGSSSQQGGSADNPLQALINPRVNSSDRESSTPKDIGQTRKKFRELNAQAVAELGGSLQDMSDEEYQNTYELNYTGSLAGLLDNVAGRAGLWWEYKSGVITFHRVMTQTFYIKALPGSVKSTAAISLSAGEGSSTAMGTNTDTDGDVWAAIDSNIKAMLSKSGRHVLDPKSGSVTVVDAVTNVKRIGAYVEKENKALLRQVRLNVEVLKVELSQDRQTGIDWSVVASKVNALSSSSVGLIGAESLLTRNTNAGVGMVLERSSDSVLSTTSFFIKALETYGNVSSNYSTVVTTTNRQAVPIGVLNQKSYLKEVSQPSSSSASSDGSTASAPSIGSATLTPGQLTTGFSMTLLPAILDSNRVLIQSVLSISNIREISSFSSGSGEGSATIQIPSVDSFNTLQRMSVQSGDTLVLVGFERSDEVFNQNDVVTGVVPGYKVATQTKTSTVILITPQLEGI